MRYKIYFEWTPKRGWRVHCDGKKIGPLHRDLGGAVAFVRSRIKAPVELVVTRPDSRRVTRKLEPQGRGSNSPLSAEMM